MGSMKSVSSISFRNSCSIQLACLSAVTLFMMSSAHFIKWTLQPRDPILGVQGENVTFGWSFNITGDTLYAVHLIRLKNSNSREIMSYQPNGLVRIPIVYRGKFHLIQRGNHPTFLLVNAVESDEAKYCCRASSVQGFDDDSCINLHVLVRPSITVISRNQRWNETDDVTLSCNATGKPPPDVTWSNRGSNMKYSGSLLPLKNISRKQDGKYWCTANNTAGNVTAPVRVIVNYAPSITPNSSRYIVTEGNDLELHCDTDGRPQPTVTWTKMDETGIVAYPYNQQTLVIRNANRTEDGIYRCTATNGIGDDASATIHVSIFFPPSINSGPGNITVNETNDLELFCNATGNPPPRVTWSKVADPAVQLSADKGLILKNINKTDSGVYQCSASNGIGSESLASWAVIVNYKSTGTRLTSDAQSDSARVGSSITFFCTADSVPASELELRYGNLSLGFFSNGMFSLTNINTSNQGTYECFPRNILGTGLIASLSLTVIVAPTIDYVSQNTTVNETTDVMLFCNATGNPTPKITWTFLKDSTNVERGEHLFLQQVKRAHTGRYRCTATNHVRNPAWADVYLRVNYKPKVKDGPLVVKTWINHETSVKCEAEGFPAPEIAWTRNGTVTSSSTPHARVSTLTFTPKEKNDPGLLLCTAKNLLGAARRTITVKQLVAPSPPEILEIDAGVDNMEIHWKISTVDPDSPVLNYLVQVKVKDESSQWINCTEITFQISSSSMLCVMSELKSSTEYTVRIAARNVVGYSAFTIKESSTREKKIKTIDEHKGLPSGALDGIIAALICLCALIVIIVAIAKRRRSRSAEINKEPITKSSKTLTVTRHDNPAAESNVYKADFLQEQS